MATSGESSRTMASCLSMGASRRWGSSSRAPTCRTTSDAPEIDGNLFIDEGFEGLKAGDMVDVLVDEAGEYDLWGTIVEARL